MLMVVRKHFELLIAYFKFNLSASMEYRTSFLVQVFGMFLNNASFAVFWWFLFEKVGDIGGYGFKDVMILWAIASSSFGLTVIIGGNCINIVDIIIKGELDSYLLQPKNVYFNVIVSKTQISGWGDLAYGYILFFILFGLDFKKLFLFLCLSITSSLVFVSVTVTTASITFFVGQFKTVAGWIFDFLISFSIYPESIYYGVVKVMLFTLLPSGLVTMLPARLMVNFDLLLMIKLLAGVFIWFVISIIIFNKGLKRYESGNLIVQKL